MLCVLIPFPAQCVWQNLLVNDNQTILILDAIVKFVARVRAGITFNKFFSGLFFVTGMMESL